MSSLWLDLRAARRLLAAQPLSSAVAVLCLAIALGANTVLVGAVDMLLFRAPSGIASPDGVARVRVIPPRELPAGTVIPGGSGVSHPTYAALEELGLFPGLAAYALHAATIGEEQDRTLSVVLTSDNFFAVLGTRPAFGRLFLPGAESSAGAAVAVVSHAYWQRELGSRIDVVGSEIHLNGSPFTVIGVAPPGFRGTELWRSDVWLPFSAAAALGDDALALLSGRTRWLNMIARLPAGQAMPRGATAQPLDVAVSGATGDERLRLEVSSLVPLFRSPQGTAPVPTWLYATALSLLLIACANVTGVLIAQSVRRQHGTAVRMALGASRWRTVRPLVLHSGMLVLLGGTLGLLIAHWMAPLLTLLGVPLGGVEMQPRILLFTLTLVLFAGVLSSSVPALAVSRIRVGDALKGSGLGGGAVPRARVRSVLVVGQLALAFVLLSGAGLFLRSLLHLQGIELGYRPEGVLTVLIPGEVERRLPEEETTTMVTRLGTLPGVIDVAYTRSGPFLASAAALASVPTAAGPRSLEVAHNVVGAGYQRVMQIPILAGRGIEEGDRAATEPVVVVNEAFVRQVWPGESPLGRCVGSVVGQADCARVVGVVADVRDRVTSPAQPAVYVAASQMNLGPSSPLPLGLVVRVDPRSAGAAVVVRQEVRAWVGGADRVRVLALDDLLGQDLSTWRQAMRVLGAIGLIALLLSTVGLYGVIATLVTLRAREIAIRIALGAQQWKVFSLLLNESVRLAAAGIMLGAGITVMGSRLIRHQLYGVSPLDPTTYAAVALLLLLAALLAIAGPIRAAARVDPLQVLRQE